LLGVAILSTLVGVPAAAQSVPNQVDFQGGYPSDHPDFALPT
jgi:hypothetical protein